MADASVTSAAASAAGNPANDSAAAASAAASLKIRAAKLRADANTATGSTRTALLADAEAAERAAQDLSRLHASHGLLLRALEQIANSRQSTGVDYRTEVDRLKRIARRVVRRV